MDLYRLIKCCKEQNMYYLLLRKADEFLRLSSPVCTWLLVYLTALVYIKTWNTIELLIKIS